MKTGTQMKKFSKNHGKFAEVNWVLQKNVWFKAHFFQDEIYVSVIVCQKYMEVMP